TRNIAISFLDDTSRSKPQERSIMENNERPGSLLALNTSGVGVNGSLAGPADRNARDERESKIGDQQESFLDNIVYDLILEAQGPTQLRLIVNPITNEELFADLKGRLAFEKNGPQARLSGDVEVGNRSYYNYFKRFDATGKLRFTGDPLNPELNISGKYEGVHRKLETSSLFGDSAQTSEGRDEKVLVTLEITGTRNEPRLEFGIEVERNGKFEKPTSADTESDAIAFLLSGQFRDELTSAGRQKLIGENLIGLTSGVLSAPLREYIRKETGVSLDVLYYGGASFQQSADVRLSGEIGDAVVRFGGRVLNNISNTNVSVELPMSSILGTETWRNLVLTLERRVEGLENFEERSSKGARLLYRINF
ncbi:MAG: translocation/assembly module TamB domain-containing protein, partial [Ignavibacteriales bacterium]|nr:translocation/assembly module TamB domain-containing protein [Ignavibacteriales bacterium]